MTVTSRAPLSSATETTTTTAAAPPLASAPADLLLGIIQQTTAVTTQNCHKAAKLLRNQPQLAEKIVSGKTLIMLAIEKDKREISLLLAQSGHCNPQYGAFNVGLTALHLAAWKGWDDVIVALVKAAPACIKDTTTYEFIKDKRLHLTALHIAAYYGHEKAASTLILLGADLNATIGTYFYSTTPSALAQRAGKISVSKMLNYYAAYPEEVQHAKNREQIDKLKSRISATENQLSTTVSNAVKLFLRYVNEGMSTAANMMIESKVVDINSRALDGNTALIIACSRPTANHAIIVRTLCDTRGIKLKRSDLNKNNAFHHIMLEFEDATPENSISKFQNIIAQLGTDISPVNKPNIEGLSAMHLAVKLNRVPAIQVMQSIVGINWMQRTANGQNVIHLMIDNYDKVKTNIIFDLIQHAMDPADFKRMINTIDNIQKSPLLLAIKKDNKELVSKLLELGCTLNTQYAKGSTCLHFTLQESMQPNTIHILKNILQTIGLSGATSILNIQDDAGNTVVHVAILHDKIEALKELLEYFCDQLLNNNGLAPLHMAVDMKNRHAMELLIEKGADINQVNSKGETALHYAASSKDASTCSFLIAHGAKQEITDRSGRTAATIATANQHYQLRKILDSAATSHSELEQLLQEQGLSFPNHSEFSGIKAINKIGDKTFLVSTPQSNTITVLKQADSVENFREQMDKFSKLKDNNLVRVISADAITRMVHIERVNQGTLQDLKWTYLDKPIILELHHLKEIGLGLLSAMTVMCSAELDPVLTPQNVYLYCNYDLTTVTIKLGIFGSPQAEDHVYSALEEIQQVFGQSHATPTTEAVLSDDEETPPTATEASTSSNSTTIITEQAVKPHHVARWALLMYRIITRKRPYHDLNIVEVLKRANSGTLGSPESINGLDGKLKCILERCWSPKVLERPTASELSQLLKAL